MYHFYLRDTGFKALAAMGAAGTVDLALKLAFDRQFPTKPGSTGRFWGGGRAFPSGHSATSFAFAAGVGHPQTKNKMGEGGAHALEKGMSRCGLLARKRYPSQLLLRGNFGQI